MSILKSNKNRKIHVRCLYMHSLTQTRVEVWDNINNLSDGLSNTLIYHFADDTKLARVIHSVDEVRLLQQDINKVSDWSSKYQMSFNLDKCVTLRVTRKKSLV